MQVLVLAVQNAVEYADLGVATSGATLFRSLGGSLGTAVLGAIFTARLTDELAGSPAGQLGGSVDPASLQRLPAAARDAYTGAFTDALSTVFLVGACFVVLAFLLAWLIEERPLRQTVETGGVGEAFASPTSGDSLRELARLVGRKRTTAFIEGTVEAADVGLPVGAAWLLMQGARGESLDPDVVAQGRPIEPSWVREQLDVLRAGGLLERDVLTAAGEETTEKLVATHRERLVALVSDWSPDDDPRINDAIARLARELTLEPV
jgi:hypothetical protein